MARITAPGSDATVRAWFHVGRVLRMMHNDPAAEWTVAALASGVGVSRAGLARRFSRLVGEPP